MKRKRSFDILPLAVVCCDPSATFLFLPGNQMIYRPKIFGFRVSIHDGIAVSNRANLRNSVQPISDSARFSVRFCRQAFRTRRRPAHLALYTQLPTKSAGALTKINREAPLPCLTASWSPTSSKSSMSSQYSSMAWDSSIQLCVSDRSVGRPFEGYW